MKLLLVRQYQWEIKVKVSLNHRRVASSGLRPFLRISENILVCDAKK